MSVACLFQRLRVRLDCIEYEFSEPVRSRMSQEPFPPGMMFRSFLTVGSAFVLVIVALAAATFGIGLGFFPEFAEFVKLPLETQEEIMANNPEQAVPPLMFWIVVAVTALASMLIGVYVIKTAPFSHFGHAIFVAVLVFITHLQTAISDPVGKKSMTLIYMVVFPIALLVGAKWAINSMIQKYNSEDEKFLDSSG